MKSLIYYLNNTESIFGKLVHQTCTFEAQTETPETQF